MTVLLVDPIGAVRQYEVPPGTTRLDVPDGRGIRAVFYDDVEPFRRPFFPILRFCQSGLRDSRHWPIWTIDGTPAPVHRLTQPIYREVAHAWCNVALSAEEIFAARIVVADLVKDTAKPFLTDGGRYELADIAINEIDASSRFPPTMIREFCVAATRLVREGA